MLPAQSFPVDAVIRSFQYEKASDSWMLNFSGGITITIYSLWRLWKDQRIVAVSTDHGHWFGLTTPLNLADEVLQRLRTERLLTIVIKRDSGDLGLELTGGYRFEVLITSVNYECYDFTVDGQRFIATGGGG